MVRNIGELCSEIISRGPLSQYSTGYLQDVGLTSRTKWNPNRPPTGVNWFAGSGYTIIGVPRLVSGRRIAVIDEESGAIEALVVACYETLQEGKISARACQGSHVITVNTASGEVAARQVNKEPYTVNLAGKKVVGLTRREMSELVGYAARKESSPPLSPQNL